MSAAAPAARGAVLFDDLFPGWADWVDVDDLDMSVLSRGIVAEVLRAPFHGRLESSYRAIAGRLGIREDRVVHYGIDLARRSDWYEERRAAYDELQAAWVAEIRRRTGGAA